MTTHLLTTWWQDLDVFYVYWCKKLEFTLNILLLFYILTVETLYNCMYLFILLQINNNKIIL